MAAVVGATAAGKSDLAVELALRLDGEAVNADSMQLYRGMDIGTAKLTRAEMRGVPHHLLDVWDVTRTASVAEYQRLSADAIAGVRARGRVPILVGGSGLYVRAALDRMEFPGTDPSVRARLEDELARVGPGALHERLRGLDPAAAEAILPSNGRRIVRALEVIEITGRPFTATLPEHVYRHGSVAQVGLSVPRDELDERIALRVARMWDAGLVDEVRELEKRGLRDGLTAGRALGYAQVLRFLAGEWTEDQARDETIRATRRFARRQESWFRRDPRVAWLPYDAPDLVDRALALVAEASR
ncbi:tRNA (adenosine(37)-N6)-dimethylallyltransferase MiaA [Actinomadura chibensis]|uniref:tRNA dimethylallyltransferase n=1 Tax=Actinomadura chibensis TaxID=392828 RepID=A0A5D0NH42_9ACTN|nr:tRNA (adenosine(37)-N6)-dimethylallyltransferase MiaA [Actinomadura chibensis]